MFKNWIGKDKKVGVLLMMNCWMMNLHTMYSLRETVKCLVAPQGDIGTPGYNYKDILKYLFNRNNLFKTPEKLAIKCVTTSENKRLRRRSKRLRDDKEDVIDKWKIFAIDLQRKVGSEFILKDHLDKLNQIIVGLCPKNQEKATESRRFYRAMRLVTHDFTKAGSYGSDEECFIIDVINWLNILCDLEQSNPPTQWFPIDGNTICFARELIENIHSKSDMKQCVLSRSNGKDVYNRSKAVVGFAPTGYGLFFPNSISRNQNLIDNVRKDSLLNNCLFKWKEFIKSIYPKEVWEPFF